MNIAVILSGGVGTRLGADIPKQYIEVKGKPIIWYCLRTFLQNQKIDAMVVGVADAWREYVSEQIREFQTAKSVYYSQPGETRQLSIYNALCVLKDNGCCDDDIIIIHDAARPLVSDDLINGCLDGCKEAEGVMPVIPVKDTIYQSIDGIRIANLLRREELYAGQSPESFVFGKYLKIHENMGYESILRINGSTEIAYLGGMRMKLIRGSEMNFKITTSEDLSNFESIIKQTARKI